jgi:hypothetical protein
VDGGQLALQTSIGRPINANYVFLRNLPEAL